MLTGADARYFRMSLRALDILGKSVVGVEELGKLCLAGRDIAHHQLVLKLIADFSEEVREIHLELKNIRETDDAQRIQA